MPIHTPDRFHVPDRLAVELAVHFNIRTDMRADLLDLYKPDPISSARQLLLKKRGIKHVDFLGLRAGKANTVSSLRAAWRLRKILVREKYDFIETNGSVATLIAAAARLGLSTTHIVGIHEVDGPDWPNFSSFFRRAAANFLFRYNTYFYAVSEYARRHWTVLAPRFSAYTRLIYNAAEDDFFAAKSDRNALGAELSIPADSPIFLFVGRVIVHKGIETLLAGIGQLLEERNAYLLCAGAVIDTLFYQKVQTYLSQQTWSYRVRFLGARDDIPRLMASSDILVFPTLHDAFGLVIAEAMACGLPIVTTNVGGIPEVLDGSQELQIPPGDFLALRKAVELVLNRSPEEKLACAELAKKAAHRFTTARRAADMIALYEDVVSSRPHPLRS